MNESQDTDVQWLRRRIDGYHGTVAAFVAWGWRELPPRVFIETVEVLYREELLERKDASAIQEHIVRLVAHEGSWQAPA
jgi:hypothetical protein